MTFIFIQLCSLFLNSILCSITSTWIMFIRTYIHRCVWIYKQEVCLKTTFLVWYYNFKFPYTHERYKANTTIPYFKGKWKGIYLELAFNFFPYIYTRIQWIQRFYAPHIYSSDTSVKCDYVIKEVCFIIQCRGTSWYYSFITLHDMLILGTLWEKFLSMHVDFHKSLIFFLISKCR